MPYSGPYESQRAIPKYKIPQDGAHGDTVYAISRTSWTSTAVLA